MRAAQRERVHALVDSPVADARGVGGGSIASAYDVRLEDGRRVFVKDYGDASPDVVAREASGLEWLAEAKAVCVARVLAHDHARAILVLEWIESAPRARDFAETLGRDLAALHTFGAPRFGLDTANFIGSLGQVNTPADTWAEFYAESRLRPLLRRARDEGALASTVVHQANGVLERLADLCGPPEPPARLHGDLWSGNLMVDASGEPLLIDPAVSGGHREMDLAMMRLFGGFEPRVFDAYAEQTPLAPGAGERVPLCQLYPLLVHVVLFGGGYARDFAAAVGRYL